MKCVDHNNKKTKKSKISTYSATGRPFCKGSWLDFEPFRAIQSKCSKFHHLRIFEDNYSYYYEILIKKLNLMYVVVVIVSFGKIVHEE